MRHKVENKRTQKKKKENKRTHEKSEYRITVPSQPQRAKWLIPPTQLPKVYSLEKSIQTGFGLKNSWHIRDKSSLICSSHSSTLFSEGWKQSIPLTGWRLEDSYPKKTCPDSYTCLVLLEWSVLTDMHHMHAQTHIHTHMHTHTHTHTHTHIATSFFQDPIVQ